MRTISLRTLAFALATVATAGTAHAVLFVSGSIGGAPVGVTLENFDTLPLGSAGGVTPSGITVSFVPGAQAVTGSLAGVYAAPFLSGNNGDGFGPGGTDQPNGPDTTTYLAAGSTNATPGAMLTLLFPALEQYLGLLWGSVDSFNTLEFFNGAVSVGTLTGGDVDASPDGDQGVNGTLYVNVNSTLPFDRVVATSTAFTFEFDNVAFNVDQVPEAGSLAILGLGLLGVAAAARRRA